MAGLADQFLADAQGTAAPSQQSLADQFLADVAAPKPSSQPKAQDTSVLGELGRQLGLTARAGVTGLTALPASLGDALNSGVNLGIRGVNSVAGTNIPQLQMPSQVIQQGMNAAGVPQPQNATERVVQDVAGGMAGVAPSIGLGKVAASAVSPVTQAVGRTLQMAPGMQIMGAAGAGAGSGTARELGLNPAWQVGAGLLGAAGGVAAGSLATAGARAAANRLLPRPGITPEAAATRAEAGVDQALNELGPQARQSFGPAEFGQVQAGAQSTPTASSQFGMFQPLKQRVAQVIEQNPDVSPAAAMRSQDFRDLGMQPTLGQITRDPVQYANELNMRGLRGVGDRLANRFNQQNTQLQQALYGLAGNASDAYQAGTSIKSSLKSIDDQLAKGVTDAYAAAKASSGKDLNVPLAGLAQDYAQTLKNFGDKVPSGVRNNFNELGLMGGTQRKTFSIDDAENLLKVINANHSSDPATNAALFTLRNSVKNAILNADDQGGVYAPARQLAAQRFALHEQIPALEAAASDGINADDFVRRFLLGGKTDEVNALGGLLRGNSPAAFNEARNQLGAQLALKAFGQNVAGDAPFKPAGFAQQMQAFGPAKLGAFYTPEEIAQLNTIGRVGAYMNSFPSSAPVNTSNTAGAIGSLVGAGVKKIPVVGGLLENAQNKMFVNKALAGALSDATQKPLTPQQQGLLQVLMLNGARTPSNPQSR